METIAVVGLGYVGLPLVVEFGQLGPVIGFDIARHKVQSCQNGVDPAQELTPADMAKACGARYTHSAQDLNAADIVIVAVPTPVDARNTPDFFPLRSAMSSLGPHLKQGALVVFESTVYPGATEEVCIPALEAASGKRWKEDFFVGYSPERINPGDREHQLTTVVKVVAGDTPNTLERVADLYSRIVKPGVHRCNSIKAAEACKVIENTQRDLNIALMNELALILDRMDIDTQEVLDAAATKWNFLPFRPGLVGGHCIGVDPYYLTHKAQQLGYQPQLIQAGRSLNDKMGQVLAEKTIKQLHAAGHPVKGAQVNVLGLTFKENCTDLRNSKVVDLVATLRSHGVQVAVHDPLAPAPVARSEYGLELTAWDQLPVSHAMVAAVAHRCFQDLSVDQIRSKLTDGGCVVDVKSRLNAQALREAGLRVWRL